MEIKSDFLITLLYSQIVRGGVRNTVNKLKKKNIRARKWLKAAAITRPKFGHAQKSTVHHHIEEHCKEQRRALLLGLFFPLLSFIILAAP